MIGLPGDQIQLKDGEVWVNGQSLQASGSQAAGGGVRESIGGRRWQVQWQADTVQPLDGDTPTAKTPPLNRAEAAPATALQLTVPDGQVFVLGDNRLRSVDSRRFGTVPMQDILGKARQVWFSSDAQGVRWDRLGLVLE